MADGSFVSLNAHLLEGLYWRFHLVLDSTASPSAAARSSQNLTLFCSSSLPPQADATVVPPPTQTAAEEAKLAAPSGEEKAEPTVEELAGRLDIHAGEGIFSRGEGGPSGYGGWVR
jgi:hypothetical protein